MSILNLIVLPIVAATLCLLWPTPLANLPTAWSVIFGGTAALLPVLLVRFSTERRILGRDYTFGCFCRNGIGYTLLLGYLNVFVVLAAALAMPAVFNVWAIAVALVALLIMFWFNMGGTVRCLKLLGLLRPAAGRAVDIVERVARQLSAAPRHIYRLSMPSANAFALPMSQSVVMTDGILNTLDDNQLASIAAHEVGHLSMPRGHLLLRIFSPLASLTLLMFIKPAIGTYGLQGIVFLALALLATGLLMRIVVARSARREEERADAVGASQQTDEGVYARALERIYENNMIPVNWKSALGHPPLYDRLLAAGVTPDYPRPKRPGRWLQFTAYFVQSILFLILFITAIVCYALAVGLSSDSATGRLVVASALGGPTVDAAQWGKLLSDEGQHDRGAAILQAALLEDDKHIEIPAWLATVEARRHDCLAAAAALAQAQQRAQARHVRWSGEEALGEAQHALDDCVPLR